MNRFLTIAFLLFLCACKKQVADNVSSSSFLASQNTVAAKTGSLAAATLAPLIETFESGTKGSYTAGDVTLSTGLWNLNDALIGNLSTDVKNGAQAARIRNSGKVTMKFDYAGGAASVTIRHAKFGSDGSSTWQLWYSVNGGSTYTQTGSTITTSATTLQTATFTLSVTGNVRFEIRKTDGSTNRIDIDDFTINPSGDTGGGGGTAKKFLFDNTKAETAGNADWVIDEDNSTPQRIPTPAQSTVTSTTAETYWTGALSSWGIALAKAGHTVETLPSTGSITYGNASNAQDLSNYDVFVIDEPNTKFTDAEKTAILHFIQNGGGLFMISDHTQSDRNNDGWDSPAIWNDLMTTNSVQSNPFGISIDLTNIVELSSNVRSNSSTNPILNGSQGAVTQLDFHNGATVTINTTANSSVQGLVWQSGFTQNSTHIMAASSTYGTGRVFVVTDSSPIDDGTGASGNTLFDGWHTYSHIPLFMNASYWLAKL